MNQHLESVTAALVGYGKGILADDETVPALTKRFNTLGIQSTEECRRTYPHPASVQQVPTATLRCLRRHAPAAVPGIVFLSRGQDDRMATTHLNAINLLPGSKPWTISFSYARALQDAALEAWRGRNENLKAGQQALYHRVRCSAAASLGNYTDEMEAEAADAASPLHRHGWHDD